MASVVLLVRSANSTRTRHLGLSQFYATPTLLRIRNATILSMSRNKRPNSQIFISKFVNFLSLVAVSAEQRPNARKRFVVI